MSAHQRIPSQYTSPPQPLPCRVVHVIPSFSCTSFNCTWHEHQNVCKSQLRQRQTLQNYTAMTPFCPRVLPLWATQTPPQTNMCRWIHKPERQWCIYPKCVQPFHCMTTKRVSLVQSSGNIATHLLVFFLMYTSWLEHAVVTVNRIIRIVSQEDIYQFQRQVIL